MHILTKKQTTPQQPTSLLHIGIRKEERERRKEGVKKVKWGKGNRERGIRKVERRKERGERSRGKSK